MPNKLQHHKSDRAGESEVDWRREGDKTCECALSRSDWVCSNVRLKIMPDIWIQRADFSVEDRYDLEPQVIVDILQATNWTKLIAETLPVSYTHLTLPTNREV